MDIKHSLNLSGILIGCLADDAAIYVLTASKYEVSLSVFDPDSFKKVSAIQMHVQPLPDLQPCIDDDCIYIPTSEGQIIGFDKFNGIPLVTMDLGYMVAVSDILQNQNYIYSCCGVPVKLRALEKANTDIFSMCSNNKSDGRKHIQSQYMQGDRFFITLSDNEFFIVVGDNLYHYNNVFELKNMITLTVPVDYNPIVTDTFIVCASKIGTLEVLNKSDFSRQSNLLVTNNACPPIHSKNDIVYWFVYNGAYRIDLNEMSKEQLSDLPTTEITEAVLGHNSIYLSNKKGYLSAYNVKKHDCVSLKISKGSLRNPLLLNNHVFVASEEALHQIED
jgi:hypothetical protein